MDHSAEHEAFLDRISSRTDPWGEWSESAYAECDQCGEYLERAEQRRNGELEALLDATVRDEEQSLAMGPATATERELVRRVLDAPEAAASPLRSHRRAGLTPWLNRAAGGLALAAGVLLLLAALERWREPGERPDIKLGSSALRLIEPKGEVSAWGAFRWEGELPPGGRFELRVTTSTGRLLGTSGLTEDAEWTPGARDRAAWTDKITWSVRTLGAAREQIHREEAKAWLSGD